MATNEPDLRAGRVIRDRRDALDLTQEELAWLADMSRNSVRNAEGAKSVEDKTIRALELALALQPGAARAGDPSRERLSAPAARAAVHALLELRQEQIDENDENATSFRASLAAYNFAVEADSGKTAKHVLRDIGPYLNDSELELLREEFDIPATVWSPARALLPTVNKKIEDAGANVDADAQRDVPTAGGPTARIYQQSASTQPTPPVPPEVAELLQNGQLLDYAVVPSPTSGLKFALLAVRQGPVARGDSVRAVAAIDAVKRMAGTDSQAQRDLEEREDELFQLIRDITISVESGEGVGEARVRFLEAIEDVTDRIAKSVVERNARVSDGENTSSSGDG